MFLALTFTFSKCMHKTCISVFATHEMRIKFDNLTRTLKMNKKSFEKTIFKSCMGFASKR